MINIAILASGTGTNAENIIRYFQNHRRIKCALVISNKKDALVLDKAKNLNVNTLIINKADFSNSDYVLTELQKHKIDFIVLAGFLLLIPLYLIKAYPDKIVNIHPALLPKYGGKGMYGSIVHKAVLENQEKETGITIHFVNEEYDKGKIIFQSRFPITRSMSLQELESKIHTEEYTHYPVLIEKTIDLIFR